MFQAHKDLFAASKQIPRRTQIITMNRRATQLVMFLLLLLLLICLCHVSHAQQPQRPCGSIVGTWTVQEIKSIILTTPGIPTVAASFGLFLARNDIQARKICASCTDYGRNDDDEETIVYQKYCGPNAYGYNATVSGLVIFPIDANGDFVRGSLSGHVDAHRTIIDSNHVPSEMMMTSDDDSYYAQHWLAMLGASAGNVAIRPDYLGYGESFEYFKSFLLQPAYPTATLPLWQKAVQMVQEESNCRSYLKPSAYITGYGEGAYAAISIANALEQALPVNIVKVNVGGGPYRMGSVALSRMVANIDNNEFPSSDNYVLAMVASAFSSTNPWPSNDQQNQDLLAANYRDEIINSVQSGDLATQSLPTPITDILNPDLLAWMRNQTAFGNYAPCLLGPPLVSDLNALFCVALLRSDLTNILQDATYNIDLCHGRSDTIYHIDNLPNFDSNPNRLTREVTSGSHQIAYAYCAELAVREGLYTNVALGPITECVPITDSPTRMPTTEAPTRTFQPTTRTEAPSTLAPTPKPTTLLVEAPPGSAATSTVDGTIWLATISMLFIMRLVV